MKSEKTNSKTIREPSQVRSIEKKDRIVHTAFSLFDRKSFRDVSIRLIAKEAGVSIGTIYAYFQDKKDIFIAVQELYRDEMYQRLFNVIQEELDATDKLEDGIYAVILALRDFFQATQGVSPGSVHPDAHGRTPPARSHVARERSNGRAVVDLFYQKFKKSIAKPKSELVFFVVHRVARDMVHYLFLYPEDINEKKVYREIAAMITRYLQ
jgi:AcrR family transcriptional regulator